MHDCTEYYVNSYVVGVRDVIVLFGTAMKTDYPRPLYMSIPPCHSYFRHTHLHCTTSNRVFANDARTVHVKTVPLSARVTFERVTEMLCPEFGFEVSLVRGTICFDEVNMMSAKVLVV